MDLRLQLVAIAASALLIGGVLELVRRRRLLERYSLLWLLAGGVLLCLSIWGSLLEVVADAIGISYPPSALFVIAFAFILVLLLHFSVAVSKLADQSKVLAQRVSLLEERQRQQAEAGAAGSRPASERGEPAGARGEIRERELFERAGAR